MSDLEKLKHLESKAREKGITSAFANGFRDGLYFETYVDKYVKGYLDGYISSLVELTSDGLIEPRAAAEKLGLTEEEFCAKYMR